MIFKLNYLFLIVVLIFFTNCTERIKYSGKVIDNETINFNNFKSKEEITTYLGEPNYIDPIENKYFYIHEKTVEKNFFDKELMVRNIVVASFDLEGNIISIEKCVAGFGGFGRLPRAARCPLAF